MKAHTLMGTILFLAIAANVKADVVKGWVRLETTPSLAETMTNESGTVFVVRLGDVPDAPSSTVRVVVRRGERAVRIERAQDGEARPCGQQD